MKKVNVLITAASRRVPLVRAFRNAAERLGVGYVVTTDMNPLSPALYFGHKHHIVPLATDKYYIPVIESICDAEDIDLVIPTIRRRAADLRPLAPPISNEWASTWPFRANKPATSATINTKRFFCQTNGIKAPATMLAADVNPGAVRYPVYVKPRFGRGSVNVFAVSNEAQLRVFLGIRA